MLQDKKYVAKEKVVQQMSKDGLTQKNLLTGETENISSQEADIQFGEHEQDYQFALVPKSAAQMEAVYVPDRVGHRIVPSSRGRLQYKSYEIEYEQIDFSRLRMSWEELPGDSPAGFLQGEVPEEELDIDISDKWKPKQWNHTVLWKSSKWITKTSVNTTHHWLHHKLRQVEDDNVGVKAAHVEETLGERYFSFEYNRFKRTVSNIKKRKIKNIKKLTKKANITYLKSEKARLKLEKFSNNIPSGRKATGVKAWQKKRLQRKYAAKLRKSDKAAAKLEKATSKTSKLIARIIKKIIEMVNTFLSWLFFVFGTMLVIFIFGLIAVVILIFTSQAFISTVSYTAENQDIHDASVLITQLEANLEKEIEDISTNSKWDYIDEFHYGIDPIGHDPFSLMAWLTVKYDDFKFSDVELFLRELHNARYNLQYDVDVEIREHTYTDSDGHEHTEEYKYYILNVSLQSKSIKEIIEPEMLLDTSNDLWDRYDAIMETKGGRQSVSNPFDADWTGSISSKYGYRLNPLSDDTDIQFHRGIDITMPTGTPIHAGVTGKVIETGFNDDFGIYIVLEDKKGEVQVKYAHCDSFTLGDGSEVKSGDTIIGYVGNTGDSTGAHLHIGVKENGQYVNPIYAVDWETESEEVVTQNSMPESVPGDLNCVTNEGVSSDDYN